MRKNSPRKWLHACLDLLPVILIPVFMVYSHRHTIDSGSIQVQEKIAVDFNQLVHNPVPTSDNYYRAYNISYSTISYQDNSIKVDVLQVGNNIAAYLRSLQVGDIHPLANHKYLFNFDLYSDVYNTFACFCGNNSSVFTINLNEINHESFILTAIGDYSTLISYTGNSNTLGSFYVSNVFIYDLTQMFGTGNEPTIEEFNQLFPSPYYEYTQSKKMLIDGDVVTFDDTDIMSQMTYQLYNSVVQYFNMGNVFNLNGVYDWFNLNIFNGTAPIYIYIVWQIVLYEFVMDLMFLLYGLFMWFIDIVQHLMDKPFKSIK